MSESTEDSFWEGFVIGAGLPGSGLLYEVMGGTAPPERYHWEVDDEVWGHYPVIHLDTHDDQAYWAGYLSGFGVGTATVSAFIMYAGAELGLYGSIGVGLTHIPVATVATPILMCLALSVGVDAFTSPGATIDVVQTGSSPGYKVTPKLGWIDWYLDLIGANN